VRYSDKNANVNAINSTIDQLLLSDINDQSEIPQDFALFQNYPNPFNPSTTISYQLSAVSQVNLTVYNALGQKVWTLVSRRQEAGNYTVNFNANGLASGVYYFKLQAGSKNSLVKKMILMK